MGKSRAICPRPIGPTGCWLGSPRARGGRCRSCRLAPSSGALRTDSRSLDWRSRALRPAAPGILADLSTRGWAVERCGAGRRRRPAPELDVRSRRNPVRVVRREGASSRSRDRHSPAAPVVAAPTLGRRGHLVRPSRPSRAGQLSAETCSANGTEPETPSAICVVAQPTWNASDSASPARLDGRRRPVSPLMRGRTGVGKARRGATMAMKVQSPSLRAGRVAQRFGCSNGARRIVRRASTRFMSPSSLSLIASGSADLRVVPVPERAAFSTSAPGSLTREGAPPAATRSRRCRPGPRRPRALPRGVGRRGSASRRA